MCKCINVKMGSYSNQTIILPPWPNAAYSVGIDNCLVEEMKSLWRSGVLTIESCCGHNTPGAYPYIAVKPQSIPRMLALGYVQHLTARESTEPGSIALEIFHPQTIKNDNL